MGIVHSARCGKWDERPLLPTSLGQDPPIGAADLGALTDQLKDIQFDAERQFAKLTASPGELRSLLGILGYDWPEADETALVEMGQAWMSFADRLEAIVSDATSTATEVWTEHEGAAVAAFQARWVTADSPATALLDGANAATLTGTHGWPVP